MDVKGSFEVASGSLEDAGGLLEAEGGMSEGEGGSLKTDVAGLLDVPELGSIEFADAALDASDATYDEDDRCFCVDITFQNR